MALNLVSLVLDLYDGSRTAVTEGKVVLNPEVTVLDAADHVVATMAPVTVNLRNNPLPMVSLIATDNAGLTPSGWRWSISPQFPGAPAAGLYLVPYSGGSTQYLSGLLPTGTLPGVYSLISVTGTPTVGEVITATSPTAASWQEPGSFTTIDGGSA